MKIVIEIGDAEIQSILEGICREQFRGGNRFDNGAGYAVLKKHAIAVIEGMNYTQAVQDCVQRLAPGIVEEVCAETLRKKIKECAAGMKKKGQLPLFEAKDADGAARTE